MLQFTNAEHQGVSSSLSPTVRRYSSTLGLLCPGRVSSRTPACASAAANSNQGQLEKSSVILRKPPVHILDARSFISQSFRPQTWLEDYTGDEGCVYFDFD